MYVGKIPESIENFQARRRVTINRPLYTEEDFDDKNEDDPREPLLSRAVCQCKSKLSGCTCSSLGKRLLSFFPFLLWIPQYKKRYATRDLIAGFTLGVFQIPQGMLCSILGFHSLSLGRFFCLSENLFYGMFPYKLTFPGGMRR